MIQKKLQALFRTHLEPRIPSAARGTLEMNLFGLTKVPLLFAANPRVIAVSDEGAELKIPLSKVTKNHVSSMYFGAMTIGAEAVVGMLAYQEIQRQKSRVQFLFKDFHIDFLKRAEGHVHFRCKEGKLIASAVRKAAASGERVNQIVSGTAFVPSLSHEPVATFQITLSLKSK